MLGAIFLLAAAVSLPPKPDHYVTDAAGVLDTTRAAALNEKLAAFERQTSDQILVYVGRSIPSNTTLEEYVNLAFHEWGVGQKEKNNGAALFLFIDDRKMRIEVGYGLEGALTDARSSRIINETLKPLLRAGRYDDAIDAAAADMMAAVRGEPYKGAGMTAAELSPRTNPVIYLILFLGAVVFLVIWLIVRAIRGVTGQVTYGSGGSSSSSYDWSSSSSSSSSFDSSSSFSSDSSSSFSGGGGDSGGGGASGSW